MKHYLWFHNIAAVVFAAALLQACSAPATPAPMVSITTNSTATATGTITVSPIAIATDTAMATATIPSSPMPTHVKPPEATAHPCEIPNGTWQSDEVDTVWPMIYPMSIMFFKIQFCMLRQVDVTVHIRGDMGFIDNEPDVNVMLQYASDKLAFFSWSMDNPYGPGSFSVYGKFTSPDQCVGFIMLSKGFSLGADPLPDPVTITYHATRDA